MRNRYAPHQQFIRPAWAARAFWRVLLTVLVFEAVFAITPEVFAALLPSEGLRDEFRDGITAFGTLSQFASFGVALAGFAIILRLLHDRGLGSLIGPRQTARRDLIRVTVAVGVLLMVLEVLPPGIDTEALAETRPLATWALLVPVTLAVLLVQVGTEELFFRGYLQQQFAVLSYSPVVWMGVPSVMFGVLHYWNGFGLADGVIYATWATALGLACADLTARTGSIGAATGLHLANNAYALLWSGVAGWPSSGVALFLYPYEDPAIYGGGLDVLLHPARIVEVAILLGSLALMWLAARVALRC